MATLARAVLDLMNEGVSSSGDERVSEYDKSSTRSNKRKNQSTYLKLSWSNLLSSKFITRMYLGTCIFYSLCHALRKQGSTERAPRDGFLQDVSIMHGGDCKWNESVSEIRTQKLLAWDQVY